MSALQWDDWSCTVRVVLDDGRPADLAPRERLGSAAAHVVRDLMDDVARSASRFRADSDLSRVNAAAGRWVAVRPLTLELVAVALAAARRTDGACDPTVGGSVLAAGYDADIDVVRSRPVTAATPAPAAAGWRTVRVDHVLGRVGVPAGVVLDLGATAKAWTADAAAARVARSTGVPALVALGGDLAVAGGGTAGGTWDVLVSEQEGDPGQEVVLQGGGLATSSTRGRRWSTPTGPQHHVVDPRTGVPTAGPWRTATVVAASCAEANALSTAALVWGTAARDRLAGHPARLVDTAGDVVTTDGWPRPGEVAA